MFNKIACMTLGEGIPPFSRYVGAGANSAAKEPSDASTNAKLGAPSRANNH